MLSLVFIAGYVATFAAATANVQIIHNCAAPAADSVDVYVNGTKLLSNFAFRTATPYTAVPAGVVLTVGVAPKNSMSVADTLKSFSVGPLAADSNYVVIASGVVGSGFASNPDMLSTGFTLNYILNSKQSSSAGNVALDIFHGVTDAPGVDVKLTGTNAALVNNLQYGSASGYITVPANWYPISIFATGTSTDVGDYLADVSGLGGGAAVVLASGFLTPFIHLLAGVNHKIAVAGPNSSSVAQALATFDSINLAANANYVVVASGVVGNGFAPNPSGISTAFTLAVIPNARQTATTMGDVDLAIFHGATDAPAVSVAVQGGGTLVSGLQYQHSTTYVEVPASSYVVEVEDSSGTTVIAKYAADVTSLANGAGVVYASGFLNPAANNSGPAFGLYLSLAAGGPFIPLSPVTGIEKLTNNVNLQVYPNPANDQLTAKFALTGSSNVSVEVTDLSGRTLQQVMHGVVSGNQQITVNTQNLSSGMYFLRVSDGENVSVNKFTVAK